MRKIADEEMSKHRRDRRGRFTPGVSGNPSGRPRKKPITPKPLADLLHDGLVRTVTASIGNVTKDMSFREVLVERLLAATAKAKPKDMLSVMKEVEQLASGAADEEEYPPAFSEEDKRLLQIIEREVSLDLCCQCNRPVSLSEPDCPAPLPTPLD